MTIVYEFVAVSCKQRHTLHYVSRSAGRAESHFDGRSVGIYKMFQKIVALTLYSTQRLAEISRLLIIQMITTTITGASGTFGPKKAQSFS